MTIDDAHDAHDAHDALARLQLPHYPRTNRYDAEWILRNLMGPNPLWLMESLLDRMQLEPGMRVLDLGCGRAVTSIFLAKETGATIYATDLWIDAAGNWRRIREAGAEDLVVPIHAEAHALPFADGFFDAVVSIDAYHYFGTEQLYLSMLAELVRPGGRIGIAVPGLVEELDAVPDHLAGWWDPEFWSFHSPAWWRELWERSGVMEVEHADLIPGAVDEWALWEEISAERGEPRREDHLPPSDPDAAAYLRADGGRALGFTRVVGRTRVAGAP
jgi:SAM-dependent methyltransferase